MKWPSSTAFLFVLGGIVSSRITEQSNPGGRVEGGSRDEEGVGGGRRESSQSRLQCRNRRAMEK